MTPLQRQGDIPQTRRRYHVVHPMNFTMLFTGCYQRLFWRRDRHCFFLNWIVIVDVKGYIVFSRPGFIGHLHDSTCLG